MPKKNKMANSKSGKKKLYLDEAAVLAVLDLEDSATDYMMQSYHTAAVAMIYTIADNLGVSISASEEEELIQQMWGKIILELIVKFTYI